MTDLYQEQLLEEARHPYGQGALADADLVLEGINASCGDQLTIYAKLSPDKKVIQELKWVGQGCVISQAAMSVVAAEFEGQSVSKLESFDQSALLAKLGLDIISPGRIKCLLLGLNTLRRELFKW